MDYDAVVKRFDQTLARPELAQHDTLVRLLRQLGGGRFGKEHGLDALMSRELSYAGLVDAFRRNVPLRDFEGLRAYIEPCPQDLSGEVPLCLLRTSASTGKPKLIPYTAAFRDSIKRAHDVFSAAMFRDAPTLPLGGGTPRAVGLYQLSSTRQEALGLPVDSYVSRLYDVALAEDPFFYAFDDTGPGRAICTIPDARERLFQMALASQGWDLHALRATNPTTLLLLSRVLADETERFCREIAAFDVERARRLSSLGRPISARDLWPNLALLVTWRGGTCHLFEPHLRAAFGDVRIRAPIYAASEGVVALPLADADLGGAPAVESTFFEFLPEPFDGTSTLLLHELQQGKRYELIFTSPTGMTRYRIGDLVQVDGLANGTPTFHFLARKGRTSSVTGEKLTELQVEQAVSNACSRLHLSPVHFMLSPQIEALPYYVLSVDFGTGLGTGLGAGLGADTAAVSQLAAAVDEQLMQLNVEYEAKRSSARLGPLVLRRCKRGSFEALQASGLSGGGAVNFKLSHLTGEPVHERLPPDVKEDQT
ncbi:MAG: GH3 auxin-responsive promoter family protein [Polyangia bacterium]